jgi:TonB family protein
VTYPKILTVVRAPYPDVARQEGREGVVRLHVSVDEQGAVTEALVIRSSGHTDLDAAAVAAVKQFRYRPATVDGKPVAAKIAVSYPFRLARRPPPPDPRTPVDVPRPRLVAPPRRAAPPPLPDARLTGRVRQKGLRHPVEDAEVVALAPVPPGAAQGAVYRATTDAQGRFALPVLPAGRYRIEARAPGFQVFRVTEVLTPGMRLAVEYFLESYALDPYETVVIGKAERKEVTRYTVALPEIEKIPGTQGDALRAVQNMPGVGRAPFSLGFLVIRGSAPESSRVFFEGHPIPQLYHFMGLNSVFNSELLQRIDFYPGNFSVQYGRATGGILDVYTREGKRDGWHGYLEADLWGVGGLVEGPVGKGSLALSLRRAHIDAVLALIPDMALTAAYYDYQAMLDYPVAGGTIKALVFGSDDRLKRRVEESDHFQTAHVLTFHKAILTYRRRSGPDELRASISGDFTRTETYLGPSSTSVQDTGRFAWRARWQRRLHDRLSVMLGTDGEVVRSRLTAAGSGLSLDLLGNTGAPGAERTEGGSVWATLANEALFAEATWRPTPRVQIVPGLRGEFLSVSALRAWLFDPRLTTRFELVRKRLHLTAAVGLFHQEPLLEEMFPLTGGNPALRPERALHAALGLSWNVRRSLTLDVTGFYKHLWQLVTDSVSWVDRDGEATEERLANHGRGRVYGGELLLKKAMDAECPRWLKLQKCFGWLSYTLLRSEVQPSRGARWELFEDDQSHLFTLVLQGAWKRHWELGVRFRLASGRPEKFYQAGVLLADENLYVPARGAVRPGRMPLFHQLDVRVDKTWVFRRWVLNLYLDIQNVYSYQASEFLQYNYNFTRNGTLRGLPIVPSLGIKGSM